MEEGPHQQLIDLKGRYWALQNTQTPDDNVFIDKIENEGSGDGIGWVSHL